MAKPDGRIEKGQRLSTAISARAWNRAQDAADIVLGVRPGVTAGQSSVTRDAIIVDAINASSNAFNQYEIVQLSMTRNNVFGQNDEITLRSTRFLPRFRSPTTFERNSINYSLAVLQEPAAPNKLCKVAVSGITLARVTFTPGLFFPSVAFCGLRSFNFVTNSSFKEVNSVEKAFAFQASPVGPVRILGDLGLDYDSNLTLENDIPRNDPAAALTAWCWVML